MSNWDSSFYPKCRRDNQRMKEYRSEWDLARALPDTKEGLSKSKLRSYLRMVAKDDWIIARFGRVIFDIEISRRRKSNACCRRRAGKYFLHFPDNEYNPRLLVLHEFTHMLCYDQDHDPIFCTLLLQIVTHFMGKIVGKELRRQFGIHGVRIVG